MSRNLTFPNLKLSRVGHLKNELERLKKVVKDTYFRVRVSVGDQYVETASFKIVSTFNQLPQDLQTMRLSRLPRAR